MILFEEHTNIRKLKDMQSDTTDKRRGILPTLTGFIVRHIMASPRIYSSITLIFRGRKKTQSFVDRYIRPEAGNKILDIGCGTGDILSFLPDVDYSGFDQDRSYIEIAAKRFGTRGKFFCKSVSGDAVSGNEKYDIIIAMGILHHLNNDESRQLFDLAYRLLKPEGHIVTYDGCFVEKQSVLQKIFLQLDRGKFVRKKIEYEQLAKTAFDSVTIDIRHDLLNIPYTIIIMDCKKRASY